MSIIKRFAENYSELFQNRTKFVRHSQNGNRHVTKLYRPNFEMRIGNVVDRLPCKTASASIAIVI